MHNAFLVNVGCLFSISSAHISNILFLQAFLGHFVLHNGRWRMFIHVVLLEHTELETDRLKGKQQTDMERQHGTA